MNEKVMEVRETLQILQIAKVSLIVPDKSDAERCQLALEWIDGVMEELKQVEDEQNDC